MKLWPSCNALLKTRGSNFTQTLQRKDAVTQLTTFMKTRSEKSEPRQWIYLVIPFGNKGPRMIPHIRSFTAQKSISVTFTISDTARWIQSAVSSQQSRPYLKVSRSIAPPWLVGLKRYSSNNMARLDVYRFWSCRFERRVTSNNICGGAWLNFPADEEAERDSKNEALT
jgi:hypothetical protein